MAKPRPRMRAGPARHTGLPRFAGGKPPGRSLERRSDAPPRGMIVHDRIRLTGRLQTWPRGSHRSRGASRFITPVALRAPKTVYTHDTRRIALSGSPLLLSRGELYFSPAEIVRFPKWALALEFVDASAKAHHQETELFPER